MPQQRIEFEGMIHEFPDDFSEAEIAAALSGQTPAPTGPPEPSTYWGGFGKGLKEGAIGGAKGFATGMLKSPVALLSGAMSTVTHPIQAVTGMVRGIQQIPAAVRASAMNPEGWGESVGSLTGQTMLTAGAPKLGAPVRRAAPAAVRSGQAATRGVGAVMESAGSHPWMLGAGGYGGFGPEGALVALAASPALKAIGKRMRTVGQDATPAFEPRPLVQPIGKYTPSQKSGGSYVGRPVTIEPSPPAPSIEPQPSIHGPTHYVPSVKSGGSYVPHGQTAQVGQGTARASLNRSARGPRPPTEGVQAEQLFRALSRKPVLSAAEQLQLEQLRRVVGGRATDVGLSFAAGGKRGIP